MIRYIPFAAVLALVVAFAACDTGPAPSLYDPDATFEPDPVIESVEPQGGSLAGIGAIIIRGSNFPSDPSRVRVYFGGHAGTVLEASPTQLRVRPPNAPGANRQISVSVLGAVNFSNSVGFSLEPAVEFFGGLAEFEEPFGIATDDDHNLYVSLFSANVSAGIKRITQEGVRTDYVSSTFKWDALDVGPDGSLFGVRGVRAVFRFPPGGGSTETYVAVPDTRARLLALDVDDLGNIWTGGSGSGNIFRISSDRSVGTFSFEPSVRALKLFGDHLYIAATQDGSSAVWRFPISGAELGAGEVFFALSDQVPGAEALSLAFAASGELFVGTDAAEPILVVSPQGTAQVLYPGILQPSAGAMAWGPDPYLYVARRAQTTANSKIRRVNTQRAGSR